MGVTVLSRLPLGGQAEPFLFVNRRPYMTAITEVQGPVQSIIYERVKLFEVIVMVAPVAHTHLNA